MADDTELFPSALCKCSQKPAIHVHCYCNNCNGKVVNRRTQLNHIRLQGEIKKICTTENHDVMTDRDVEMVPKARLSFIAAFIVRKQTTLTF